MFMEGREGTESFKAYIDDFEYMYVPIDRHLDKPKYLKRRR